VDLSLTRTSSPPDPPKSIHLNPFHYTATKSSFTPLEITTGQDKIYGPTAHSNYLYNLFVISLIEVFLPTNYR
jgi:hypothetical protein